MLLTAHERDFLAAFIYEATTDPFKGPATQDLHRRNICYTDLPHLVTAYYRENAGGQEGFGGKYNPTPAPCPWPDRDAAVRRNREIGEAIGLAREAFAEAARYVMQKNAELYRRLS